MKTPDALAALAALAHASRLEAYRLLVRRGPQGYMPGELAARLGVPAATLSFHLKALRDARLVNVRREGRTLHYSADFGHMQALVGFLTDNCCSLATSGAEACCPPAAPVAAPIARRRA